MPPKALKQNKINKRINKKTRSITNGSKRRTEVNAKEHKILLKINDEIKTKNKKKLKETKVHLEKFKKAIFTILWTN